MLLTYKNIFPFTIALIGGLVVSANQPDVAIAQYVPPERPRPERTQGGGSRLHNLPIQILSIKSNTTEVVSANLSIISLRQNACIC